MLLSVESMEKNEVLNILISAPNYSNTALYLPYIFGLLKAEVEQNFSEPNRLHWMEPVFLNDEPKKLLAQHNLLEIDVLGLSCYTWNWELNREIAKVVKEVNPSCLVVAGGPEPDIKSTDFFSRNPMIDLVVFGDGEISFRKILEERLKARDYSSIQGVYCRESNQCGEFVESEKKVSFDAVSPYADITELKLLSDKYRRNFLLYAAWETNRGCPYKCSFCDWGSNTNSRIRQVPFDRLQREANWFSENQVSKIFIVDANFGILPRDTQVTDLLVSEKRKTSFPKEVFWCPAKNNTMDRIYTISERMYKNGLAHNLGVGFQSTDEAVLKAMRRKNLGTDKKYKSLIPRYKSLGVPVSGILIIGCPEQTKDSYIQSVHDLLSMGFDEEIRTHLFSVLPNAPANNPEYRTKFKISTIRRNMIRQNPMKSLRETPGWGKSSYIIKHACMSTDDWIEMILYSVFIQTFHCMGITRYLSRYLEKRFGIKHDKFYPVLFEALRRDDRLQLLLPIEEMIRSFISDSNAYWGMDRKDSKKLLDPEIYLFTSAGFKIFDVLAFVKSETQTKFESSLRTATDLELDDVFHFQRQMIVSFDYDQMLGRRFKLAYNWPQYLSNLSTSPLRAEKRSYSILSQTIGSARRIALDWRAAPKEFQKERYTQAVSLPVNRRHSATHFSLEQIQSL